MSADPPIAWAKTTAPKRKHPGHAIVSGDWYVEPKHAVEALFKAHKFSGTIYDPCCGCGTIPTVARAAGYDAFGSDLRRRNSKLFPSPEKWPLADFWKPRPELKAGLRRIDNIVFNPPYSGGQAQRFIEEARCLARGQVAALVRLDFIASKGRMRLINEAPARSAAACMTSVGSCGALDTRSSTRRSR